MWKQFLYESQQYFFNLNLKDDSFTVYLSDFINAWKGIYSSDTVKELFKHCNSIEGLVEIDKILNVFDSDLSPQNTSVTKTITIKDENLELNLVSETKDISFCFNFKLISPDEFYHVITLPLLMIVKELSNHKDKLKGIIKDKDEEITEYKLGGAKLFRSYLQTYQFDETTFIKECNQTAESNLLGSINCLDKVFDDEVKSLYSTAIEVCRHNCEKKPCNPKDNVSTSATAPASEKESKNKKLQWEVEPQKVKRFKTKQNRLKL